MGTAKRERQKANRQARLEELAREAKKQKTRKRGTRIAIVVIGGLLLLFLLARVVGGDDEETPAVTTTVAPATTAASDTTDAAGATGTTAATDTTAAAETTAAPTTTVEFAYGELECPEADGSSELPDSFESAPAKCIEDGVTYQAIVTTNQGSFTIDLDTEGAPGTVNNFVVLARYGYYDGRTGCHRVIRDFVVQCGRPGEDETAPGYNIPDELPAPGEYQEGVVAMANTGQPNTGGGQWFIVTGPDGVSSLTPDYSILGTVSEGYDTTVQALENLADPTTNGVPPLVPIEIVSVEIVES
ncbi:MAG: peptidylprolyl isomerase [Actinomycetes bacterium]